MADDETELLKKSQEEENDDKKKVGFQSNEGSGDGDEDDEGDDDSSSSGYTIKIAVPNRRYGNNRKNSSMYTGLSFIPMNLWQQFLNPVFQFYLFIMVLEVIPPVSITEGLPRTMYPYGVVVFVQMLIDYFVTFKVNNLDNIQNNQTVGLNPDFQNGGV